MQREIALKIIQKTISDSSFTNLLMRKELEKLPKIQRPFVTNLVNSVLKKYHFLEFQHADLYSSCSLRNRIILSMALYEKFFLNEKDYVVNNEYVNLGKNEYDKSFINAILHKITYLKSASDDYINYSIPEWIYNLLQKQYSSDEFSLILENYQRTPITYYRINHHLCDFDSLKHFNIQILNSNIFTSKDNLINTDEFLKGYFYVQDINASSLVDEFVFDKDDLFLDACAAPGSKLFNALEKIKPLNTYANDINETRVNLIRNKAILLGFKDVHYSCFDASRISEYFDFKFDKILLDVPCSGLGVIGRRSDIKFHIKSTSLDELQAVQKDILISTSKLLKSGGTMIYSTCTLNKKENSKQVESFLLSHTDYKLLKEKTIINLDGDMFYFAVIKRL